jgi:hypothetical protein
LIFSACYIASTRGAAQEVSKVNHRWTIEEVNPDDREGLRTWAHGICRGLDIDAAAKAINVAPTAEAVVDALTDSLPRSVRKEVADVCFKALKERS